MVRPPKPEASSASSESVIRLTGELLNICSAPAPTSLPALWAEHLQIRSLLDQIQIEQKQDSNAEAGDWCQDRWERCLEPFLKWTEEAGIRMSGVEVGPYPALGVGCLGLVAKLDLAEDELFLEIPRRATIRMDKDKPPGYMREAVAGDPILGLMPNVGLAVHLLCEKVRGEESFWQPYIRMLPKEYDTPLFFSVDEMQGLKGSPLFEDALRHYRNISRQFAYFHQILSSGRNVLSRTPLSVDNFTFGDYKWAVSSVSTRVNLIGSEADSGVQIPALIPCLDLANHLPGRLTTDYDDEKQMAICYANRPYKKGEQVFIFYGGRSNGEFLLHGGFVFGPANPNDWMKVRLGLSKNDKSFDEKSSILGELGLKPNDEFRVEKSGGIPIEMVQFVRVFLADTDQLRKHTDQLKSADVSPTEDAKTLTFLQNRFELLLKGYPEAGDDQPMHNRSSRVEMVGSLIDTEKAILMEAFNCLEQKLVA